MPESPTTPIFIGGLYKSGTSLLRAMLGQHANIAAGLETNWFEVDWAAGLGRGGEPLADYVGRCGGFFGLEPGQAADLARASADVVAFVNGLLG
ncbi:MAG: sulfotransferase, partial [Alphaproteobacteria bacterium]|nr:sulfotransferase [Alphaproteobacteria bacterium]